LRPESCNIVPLKDIGHLDPVYASPPGDDVTAAFRKHVAQTGQPETFPTISTSHPPEEGTVAVLFHPVEINPKTRHDKAMGPCPICSPTAPKWLHEGSLIWCEATKAIYCVGPDCYKGLWADGRMDRAINLFTESAKAKADGIRLYHLILRIPRLLGWVAENRTLAEQITALHTSFGKDQSRLRAVLSRSLKASDGIANDRGPLTDIPIGRVSGRPFLAGRWSLAADIDEAANILRAFPVIRGDDLTGWADALTPSARADHCRDIERARDALARADEKMRAAHDFLLPRNIEILGRWARGEGSPTSFSVSATTSRVTFRSGDAMWQGPAQLPRPTRSVEPIRGWSLQDAA
jgi:hypothetical protein